jgi:hypothetical protein
MALRRRKTPKDDYPRPWEVRPISRERWQRHRATMMARDVPGRRPDEWWLYERKCNRPAKQATALYAMGELRGGELETLMKQWRGHFERMEDCTAAERRAYLKMLDVPPDVVATWDAEQ